MKEDDLEKLSRAAMNPGPETALQRKYYASVRMLAASFVYRLHRGDFLDANHAHAAMKEEAHASDWAQTTGLAYQALLCSDNEAVVQTEIRADIRARACSFDELVKLAAGIVVRLDVLDEVESALDLDDPHASIEDWFAAQTASTTAVDDVQDVDTPED